MVRNSAQGWGWPARALHWAMALAIIGTWLLGQSMTALPDADLRKFGLYQLHKSIGLTILAFALLRLLWRALNPSPAQPAGMPPWQRHAAAVSHVLLYLLLLLIPLTGWLMVSASPWGIPTLVFGAIPVPHLLTPDAAVEATWKRFHEALTLLLALLVAVHVAGALKHHLVDRDTVLRRMVIGR